MPSEDFLRRMRERAELEMQPGRLLDEAGNLWVVLEVCEAGCHVILRSVAQPNNPNRTVKVSLPLHDQWRNRGWIQ